MNNSTCSRRSLVKGMAGAAAFAIVGGLGLAGCGDPAAKADGSAPSDAAFKIGVLQLTEHPALDAANKGFVAAVEEAGIGTPPSRSASCSSLSTRHSMRRTRASSLPSRRRESGPPSASKTPRTTSRPARPSRVSS